MKDYEQEFKELLAAIAEGSEEAARKFLDQYGGYVIAVIRRRLHEKLRSKFDSQDFLQDVWASFIREPPGPEVFADTKGLLRYLAKLARGKVHATSRKRLVLGRYNVNRENSLQGSAKAQAEVMLGKGPSPSEVFVANETLNMDRGGLAFRMTARLLRLGYNYEEIADFLDVHVRQVKRYVHVLRTRAES